MPKISKLLETAEDTEAAFYDAIGRADIEALMSLWADEEDIVCIHPGAPRLVGHGSIRASWEAIFEQGNLHIHPVQLHTVQNLMTSVHCVIEEINSTDVRHQDIHILATNVYVKTPHGWRIVVHHASVVPGKAPIEQAASAMLH